MAAWRELEQRREGRGARHAFANGGGEERKGKRHAFVNDASMFFGNQARVCSIQTMVACLTCAWPDTRNVWVPQAKQLLKRELKLVNLSFDRE